jgi:hypothetical protein
MSTFKVTSEYLQHVLQDENIVGFMADMFPNRLVRNHVYSIIINCLDKSVFKFYILYGTGSNGKTTFLKLLNEIFGSEIQTHDEITRRELIITREKNCDIFITCNSIDNLYSIFEGDEWKTTIIIPCAEVFTGNKDCDINENIKGWVKKYKTKAINGEYS